MILSTLVRRNPAWLRCSCPCGAFAKEAPYGGVVKRMTGIDSCRVLGQKSFDETEKQSVSVEDRWSSVCTSEGLHHASQLYAHNSVMPPTETCYGSRKNGMRTFAASASESRSVQAKEATQEHQTPSFSEYLQPTFHALFVDAAGTLLSPSEPAAEVYLRYGKRYGVDLEEKEVLMRYRRAYSKPWAKSSIRYVDDGKPFWRFIVAEATGVDNEEMFEEIYEYYARGEAWVVSEGAREALLMIRDSGIKTAIVSNFDTRLHRIVKELDLNDIFDAIIVSADVGAEKPNPMIFLEACRRLEVNPEHVIHVGDDRRNDLYGARDAGCFAWLWGEDVINFHQVRERLETGNLMDSLSGI